jgi:hypothetical protein
MKLGDVITSILAMRGHRTIYRAGSGRYFIAKKIWHKGSSIQNVAIPIAGYPFHSYMDVSFYSTGGFAIWGSLIAVAGVIVYFIVNGKAKRNQ